MSNPERKDSEALSEIEFAKPDHDDLVETKVDEENVAKVEEENKPKQKKGRVFIKNLIFDISEKILRKAFTKYGEIIDVAIPINPANNKPKGFCFVEFANKNCA